YTPPVLAGCRPVERHAGDRMAGPGRLAHRADRLGGVRPPGRVRPAPSGHRRPGGLPPGGSPMTMPARRSAGALKRGVGAVAIGACVVGLAAIIANGLVKHPAPHGVPPSSGEFSHRHVVIKLPARPASYLGAFAKGVPESYAPI